MNKKYNIWLAYVSYPIATAVYYDRALRKNHNITTCGPNIPESIVTNWGLESLQIKDLNISLASFTPDMTEFVDNHMDLFLWVESIPGYFPLNMDKLKCPTACYFIDSHLNLNWHIQWAPYFDYVFIAQKEYIPDFKKAGCRNVYWLPLGCDPEIHSQKTKIKEYDVGFVGSLVDKRRIELTTKIHLNFNLHYEKAFLDDMANVFSKSKIVFNNAIKNDLNMRVFEVMSTGSFLLTDKAVGLEEMFVDKEDMVIYEDDNILKKIKYYLDNEEEREQIAKRGQQLVLNAHTYEHRCNELIKVCLEGKDTTPSAQQWREMSLIGI
ncbi:MAG: glycosyltransferase [Candidatus Gastranaerophilaceae bacterium]|jgi:glycosyltransferase involved in cell wall biosynthesis